MKHLGITTALCSAILVFGCEKRYAKLTVSEAFPDPAVRQLAKAASAGNTNEIDHLLAQGVNVNASGTNGITPLWWSLITYNLNGFTHLLQKGANPNVEVTGGYDTIMYMAALAKNSEFLEAALKNGGDANLAGKHDKRLNFNSISEGQTPIFAAILSSNRRNMDLLIANRANINFQNPGGITPLISAADLNDFSTVYYLLTNGADPAVSDKTGNTILWDLKHNRIVPGSEADIWKEKVIDLLRKKGISVEGTETNHN